MSDLRPYLCTFEDCTLGGDKTYASRGLFTAHESLCHDWHNHPCPFARRLYQHITDVAAVDILAAIWKRSLLLLFRKPTKTGIFIRTHPEIAPEDRPPKR